MLSPDSEARIKEIQTICGDSFSDLLVRFAPDRQMQVCKDLESVYAGSYPSLSEINMTYGDNSAAEWLIYQLTFLGLYAGVKEKFTEDNILQLALVIQHEYYHLNIAEMMLFFVRFMAGNYEAFYGVVDPLKITVSLKAFCQDRMSELARIESEQEKKRRDEERLKRSKECVTYEEYLALKASPKGTAKQKAKPYEQTNQESTII